MYLRFHAEGEWAMQMVVKKPGNLNSLRLESKAKYNSGTSLNLPWPQFLDLKNRASAETIPKSFVGLFCFVLT